MLRTGIFILTMFCYTLCHAQSDSINKLPDRPYELKLSYNSSLIYPGISAGVEFPIGLPKEQEVGKQSHHKSVIKDKYIDGNLNWYHHPGFHDNLYLTAEWVMRRTRIKGFFSEFSSGAGYSRTFLGGTTYKVDDNGNVSVLKLAGYNYALITIGGAFGYDFSVKKQLPFSAFAKMNMFAMFPYNSTIYFRPVLELGIRGNPGQIIKKLKKV